MCRHVSRDASQNVQKRRAFVIALLKYLNTYIAKKITISQTYGLFSSLYLGGDEFEEMVVHFVDWDALLTDITDLCFLFHLEDKLCLRRNVIRRYKSSDFSDVQIVN